MADVTFQQKKKNTFDKKTKDAIRHYRRSQRKKDRLFASNSLKGQSHKEYLKEHHLIEDPTFSTLTPKNRKHKTEHLEDYFYD